MAFMVACDWQDRGLENLDMVGTSCNPTFNYSDFFQAFHVRPTTDLHGKSAIVVKDIIDEALDEIEKNSINELEQKYFLDNTGKVIRWGVSPMLSNGCVTCATIANRIPATSSSGVAWK